MTTWDPVEAFELARKAYTYVARTVPLDIGYSLLDSYTEAAYEAERAGDWPAYVEALRELCRTARDEGRRAA
jgi:hypothetical protein